jgi:Zn-dependent M28 family amino/carboxypeptidase
MRSRASASRIAAHVHALAGEIGERNIFHPAALDAAAAYIANQWQQQGYEVASQSYLARGIDCSNLEITHRGARRPDRYLLVGAHYDSVYGSPGANDNGSGVASLLELSRIVPAEHTDLGIRFVAFVNEEPPFFYWHNMGSMVYAALARQRGDDIRLMMSLETMGYYSDERHSQRYPPLFQLCFPDRGNFIGFVSDLRSRRWLRRTVSLFKRYSDFPVQSVAMVRWVPGIGWSDHLSFWRQGYRALMVTDTALYRYPYYHTPHDTPDRVDCESLARVTDGLAGALLELASSPLQVRRS